MAALAHRTRPGVAGPERRARKRIGSAKAAAAQDRLIALVERGIAAVVVDALIGIGRAPASAGPRRLAPLCARPALGVSVGKQQSHYCDTEQNKTDCAHGSSPSPSFRAAHAKGEAASPPSKPMNSRRCISMTPSPSTMPSIAGRSRASQQKRAAALPLFNPRAEVIRDLGMSRGEATYAPQQRPSLFDHFVGRHSPNGTHYGCCAGLVRQSGLAPENVTTLAHFSISKRIEIA